MYLSQSRASCTDHCQSGRRHKAILHRLREVCITAYYLGCLRFLAALSAFSTAFKIWFPSSKPSNIGFSA